MAISKDFGTVSKPAMNDLDKIILIITVFLITMCHIV